MSRTQAAPDADLDAVLATARRSGRKKLLYWLLAVLAAGGLAFALLGLPGRSVQGPRYVTEPVTRGSLVVRVTATGTLEPVNQVEVGTEVSGTIESVNVDFNDRVQAGLVLAQLDTIQLQARLRQSEAALSLARARVRESQATVTETDNRLKRTRGMIAKGLSSQEELDGAIAASARAEAGLAVASAQVDQAQAEVDANRRTLEKASIRAPIDGIVLKRQVEPGQTVAASLQTPVLFTLAENLAQMELHVDVDEADVGQVAVGQPAEFTVDAYPDARFPARIEQVRYAPETIDGVVTYETLLSVDNAALLLRPGMTATAEIEVNRIEEALLVPNAALRFSPPRASAPKGESSSRGGGLVGMLLPRRPSRSRQPNGARDSAGGGKRVWVVSDGEPRAVPIRAGASDGAVTQVLDGGLDAGTEVIVDSITRRK